MSNLSLAKTFAVCVLCAVVSARAYADELAYDGKVYGYDEGDIDWGATAELFYDSQICNHLEVGFRWGHPVLDKSTKWNQSKNWGFVGTISELQEEQSYFPYNILVAYNFNYWFSLGFVWDSLEVIAHTQHTEDMHNDGHFITRGPTITGILTIPDIMDNLLVPYAELGLNFASGDFEADYWWEYGYSTPADYKSLGSPKDGRYRNKKHRRIDTKSASACGLVFGIGAKYYFTEHLCLDLSYRHISAENDCHFYFTIGSKMGIDYLKTKLPLDYSVLALGLRYAF